MDYQSEVNYILSQYLLAPKQASHVIKKGRPALYQAIQALVGNSFSEKAWRYSHACLSTTCIQCTSPVKFLDFKRGFTQYCSTKCMANNRVVQQARATTIQEKYGASHYSKTAEYKTKFKQTCMDRYGVKNPGQIPDIVLQRARAKQRTFFDQMLVDTKEFATPEFDFEQYTNVRDTELSWKCVGCYSIFQSHLVGRIPKCITCWPSAATGCQSSVEKDILREIRNFYSGTIIENSRNIIAPQELDLYFPDQNFAIEVNGVYWHSSLHLPSSYHQDKFNKCTAAGITLLMVTDHEWANKRQVVINMIKHRLGMVKSRTYARKCSVGTIDAGLAREFLEAHHMNGYSVSSVHMGMFYNNKMVAVLSYSIANRFKRTNSDVEIVRLAFDGVVIGALGKFVSRIRKYHPDESIVTYADLRYGTGLVYNKNNFVLLHTTKPGYWYYLKNKMYHRLSWTKKKLVSMGYDATKTEEQIMINDLGALRVYDCGHHYYKLT